MYLKYKVKSEQTYRADALHFDTVAHTNTVCLKKIIVLRKYIPACLAPMEAY